MTFVLVPAEIRGNARRAADLKAISRGCTRLRDPMALAQFAPPVVSRLSGGGASADHILAEQLDGQRPITAEAAVKPSGSRSRDESPAPFPDVASPESTSSSSGDGFLSVGRSKLSQKRSNTHSKLQTPLAQATKPLPVTPDASTRPGAGRVSESPAKTTPVLASLGIPSTRPVAQRAASHQPVSIIPVHLVRS